MKDNLSELVGAAEFFDSHTSPEFIGRLASMYMLQDPACVVVRGLPVTGDSRPNNLEIPIAHREQTGEKFSREVFELLNERIGGNRVVTDMGNVIRVADPDNAALIKVEPTHTHPEVSVNNMFCNVADGAISRVTFVDDVWNKAIQKERDAYQKYGMINLKDGKVLWYADFVNEHDIFEKLARLSKEENTELAATAMFLANSIKKNAREYFLFEGDMIFFSQLKTLRGAPAYPAPASGIEKRWYQSMTYA